jgi:S1-C subfamily serine protease
MEEAQIHLARECARRSRILVGKMHPFILALPWSRPACRHLRTAAGVSRPAAQTMKPIALLSVLCMLSGLTAHAEVLTPQQLYARLSPSVWLVHTFDANGAPLASGSAVVVAPETLVTNCHVLRRSRRFTVTNDNVTHEGHVQYLDVERDLCQVTARNLHAPAVVLGDSDAVVVGQKVYTLGNPRGLERTFSDGMVSALRRSDDQKLLRLIQISAPISHGSSGGGLFDEQGRLLGITSGGFDDAQNLNFAIPINLLSELAARSQAALKVAAVPSAQAAPPTPATATPTTTTAVLAPSIASELSGRWTGTFSCGAYLAQGGQVSVRGAWKVPAVMTVAGSQATVVRGDSSYRETLTGTVDGGLALALQGQGAMTATSQWPWTTRLSGLITIEGGQARYKASGAIHDSRGVHIRDCSVVLGRGATP